MSDKKIRIEKKSILDEIIGRVENSAYCFMINYDGLTVDVMTKLRRELDAQSSRLTVVKNTFIANIARKEEWPEDAAKWFTGPTAIVTGSGDVSEVAKILVKFAKDNEKMHVKGADFEKQLLGPAEVEDLSKLPSKDAMRAMLLSTFNAPATKLVRVFNASLLQLLYALKAYEEKQGGAQQ